MKKSLINLKGVSIFWIDEKGRSWCSPEGAKFLNQPDPDVEIQRKRSGKSYAQRGPSVHATRYRKSRAKNKKIFT